MTRPEKPDHHLHLTRLLGPAGPELTCDQCFDLLDQYVELELAGALADQHVPGMRAHLEGCPACDEDHESLFAFVASEDGVRDGAGRRRPRSAPRRVRARSDRPAPRRAN